MGFGHFLNLLHNNMNNTKVTSAATTATLTDLGSTKLWTRREVAPFCSGLFLAGVVMAVCIAFLLYRLISEKLEKEPEDESMDSHHRISAEVEARFHRATFEM